MVSSFQLHDNEEIFRSLGSMDVESRWGYHPDYAIVPSMFPRIAERNPLRKSKWMVLEDIIDDLGKYCQLMKLRRVCCEIRSLSEVRPSSGCVMYTLEFDTPSEAVGFFQDLLQCQGQLMTRRRRDHDVVYGLGLSNMWSASNSHDLGPTVPASAPAMVLDQFTSVREAVAALNARMVECEAGYCIVHSLSQETHFLIWRQDAEKVAFEMFALEKNELVNGRCS